MIQKIVDRIFEVVELLIFIFFATLSVLIFFQVFNRFVTNNSLTWSEELCRYLMIWTVFLASAVVYRQGAHMSVDNLVIMFHGMSRKVLNTIAIIFQIVFIAILLWGAYALYPIVSLQLSPSNGINMAIPYTAIPVSGILMYIAIFEKYVLKRKPTVEEEGVIQQ